MRGFDFRDSGDGYRTAVPQYLPTVQTRAYFVVVFFVNVETKDFALGYRANITGERLSHFPVWVNTNRCAK